MPVKSQTKPAYRVRYTIILIKAHHHFVHVLVALATFFVYQTTYSGLRYYTDILTQICVTKWFTYTKVCASGPLSGADPTF